MTSTGFVVADADDDYRRMRRHQAWSRLATRLRGDPACAADLLQFGQVRAALGATAERDRGLEVIDVDSIVGTVGRVGDFDRRFRPRRTVDAQRWQRLDRADRLGELVAPIEVYRVRGQHFVRDGHHRVSVARALGRPRIDAFVTEVLTAPDGPDRSVEGQGGGCRSRRRARSRRMRCRASWSRIRWGYPTSCTS